MKIIKILKGFAVIALISVCYLLFMAWFTETALQAGAIGGGGSGASAFTDLTDAPASYTGQSGKVATVKGTEDGLEFTAAGTGDMTKAVEGVAIAAATTTLNTVKVDTGTAVTGTNPVIVTGNLEDGITLSLNYDTTMFLIGGTGKLALGYDSNFFSFSGSSMTFTLTPTFTTVNTGQGAYELYAMDQNLLTTSTPTFASLILTGVGQSRMPNGLEVNYSSGTATMDRLVIWGSAGKELIGTDPSTNITYLGGRTNGLKIEADGRTSFIGSAAGGVIHGEGCDFSVTLSSGPPDANLYNVYPLRDFSYAVTFSTYWAVCSTGTAVITTYVGYSTNSVTNTTGQTTFIDSTITASSTTYTGGTFTNSGLIEAGKGLIIKISGMAADAIVKIYGKFTKD